MCGSACSLPATVSWCLKHPVCRQGLQTSGLMISAGHCWLFSMGQLIFGIMCRYFAGSKILTSHSNTFCPNLVLSLFCSTPLRPDPLRVRFPQVLHTVHFKSVGCPFFFENVLANTTPNLDVICLIPLEQMKYLRLYRRLIRSIHNLQSIFNFLLEPFIFGINLLTWFLLFLSYFCLPVGNACFLFTFFLGHYFLFPNYWLNGGIHL